MSFPKYEAYKDSGVEWLGEVPDHWGVMALKYVTSMKGRIGFRGYTTEDIVAEGDGAITLSPSNMVHGELDFSKATYITGQSQVLLGSRFRSRPSRIVYPGVSEG